MKDYAKRMSYWSEVKDYHPFVYFIVGFMTAVLLNLVFIQL